jgi:hypothetical protein
MMPLGPSNDTRDALVELRAAEIAADDKYGAGIAGALLVLALGKYLQARRGAPGSAA